ncbi:hypothetical protein BCAR13_1380011 [Paraburkholderia caribensis]|nr:hypothetical protein BCAR13_1380011 [Paraburkholderia caribensis]
MGGGAGFDESNGSLKYVVVQHSSNDPYSNHSGQLEYPVHNLKQVEAFRKGKRRIVKNGATLQSVIRQPMRRNVFVHSPRSRLHNLAG